MPYPLISLNAVKSTVGILTNVFGSITSNPNISGTFTNLCSKASNGLKTSYSMTKGTKFSSIVEKGFGTILNPSILKQAKHKISQQKQDAKAKIEEAKISLETQKGSYEENKRVFKALIKEHGDDFKQLPLYSALVSEMETAKNKVDSSEQNLQKAQSSLSNLNMLSKLVSMVSFASNAIQVWGKGDTESKKE